MARIRIGKGDAAKFYPVPTNFTFREMRLIKRISGHPAGKVFEAASEGDLDVILAFALVAMRRENRTIEEDALLDLDIDEIEFVDDEEKDDDDDPPATPAKTPAPE